MMDWGAWGMPASGGLFGGLAVLSWLVWLIVGVLLIVWLIKQIGKK